MTDTEFIPLHQQLTDLLGADCAAAAEPRIEEFVERYVRERDDALAEVDRLRGEMANLTAARDRERASRQAWVDHAIEIGDAVVEDGYWLLPDPFEGAEPDRSLPVISLDDLLAAEAAKLAEYCGVPEGLLRGVTCTRPRGHGGLHFSETGTGTAEWGQIDRAALAEAAKLAGEGR